MSNGPNLIKNGLIFVSDIGNHRYYQGEPTTNILPSPEVNGQFTTSNSWGTYNTNQYCDPKGVSGCGTYWSIPSISSVSNNIVTTSGNHLMRSYDVLQPQTSGGGLTAGVNYLIKKISDTQFSLHSYNASQDGSQGYINPSTGNFKVYDDFANNVKISINATNFPTMWWGAPHLPNSGLVKEIITNGGRRPNTNCMRLHVYRGDGVVDGMAYGVYTPVTSGQVITTTFWVRAATETAVGKNCSWSTYFGGNSAPSIGYTLGDLMVWNKVTITWTASATFSFYQYFWPAGSTDKYSYDICDIQVEVKSHSTNFTVGTRSVTQGLLDGKKSSTLNLTNMSFDSDGYPIFDGTNDYFEIPYSSNLNTPNGCTYELMIYPTGAGTCISRGTSDSGTYPDNPRIVVESTGRIYFDWSSTGVDRYMYSTINLSFNTWNHLVCTATPGGTLNVYVNNNAAGSGSSLPNPLPNTAHPIQVGGATWIPSYFPGKINVLRIYNKVLTSSEITQNYKAYKRRFNIS